MIEKTILTVPNNLSVSSLVTVPSRYSKPSRLGGHTTLVRISRSLFFDKSGYVIDFILGFCVGFFCEGRK